jgi:hypothetical protein
MSELLSKEDLYSISQPLESSLIGIYFLFSDDELVYIGKSLSIYARIGNHCADVEKQFNRVSIFLCSIEELDDLECKYILKYKPKYNKSIPYDSIGYFKTKTLLNKLRGKGWLIPDGHKLNGVIRRHKLQPIEKRYSISEIEEKLKLEGFKNVS